MIEHDNPIRKEHRFFRIVGHHQRRDAAVGEHRARFLADTLAQVFVQPGERFVEQQNARIRCERSQQRYALLLAAREGMRIAIAHLPEVDVGECTLDPCPVAYAVSQSESDVLRDGQVGEQRIVLKHQPHTALFGGDLSPVPAFGDRGAADRDAPGLQRLQTGREAQQRGLAAPRRTEQAHELARFHADAHVVDGEGLAEAMRDVGEMESAHRRCEGIGSTARFRYGDAVLRWPGRERVIVRLIRMTGTTPAATMVRAPSAHSSSSSSEAYW